MYAFILFILKKSVVNNCYLVNQKFQKIWKKHEVFRIFKKFDSLNCIIFFNDDQRIKQRDCFSAA